MATSSWGNHGNYSRSQLSWWPSCRNLKPVVCSKPGWTHLRCVAMSKGVSASHPHSKDQIHTTTAPVVSVAPCCPLPVQWRKDFGRRTAALPYREVTTTGCTQTSDLEAQCRAAADQDWTVFLESCARLMWDFTVNVDRLDYLNYKTQSCSALTNQSDAIQRWWTMAVMWTDFKRTFFKGCCNTAMNNAAPLFWFRIFLLIWTTSVVFQIFGVFFFLCTHNLNILQDLTKGQWSTMTNAFFFLPPFKLLLQKKMSFGFKGHKCHPLDHELYNPLDTFHLGTSDFWKYLKDLKDSK